MAIFEGEVVGPVLLAGSNKLDCIVDNKMLGRVRGMLKIVEI